MSAERIADLEQRLAARDGKTGFKRNVIAIRAELERLRKEVTLG